MKLNLGCGSRHLSNEEGWVNVDKYMPADVMVDLEHIYRKEGSWIDYASWPWEDNTVEEVMFHHSLEHMGRTIEGFYHIIQELYRVCKDGAKVTIVAPHPRSDDFINDPTHVRIITPMILDLLSKEKNENWEKCGAPNTRLAQRLMVDFKIIEATAHVDDRITSLGLTNDQLKYKVEHENNIIKQFTIVMKAIKS